MSVGGQLSVSSVNQSITGLSVQLRNTMQAVVNLSLSVNGQDTGLAILEAAGYDAADAQTALDAISYMNTVAGVYFGTAAQATDFNFNQELSQYWAGQ
jgi:hypothetical protein